MALSQHTKQSLTIINNTNVITTQVYKKLLEISVQDLLQSKPSDIKSLYGSKPDVIKEIHAVVMKTFLVFVQNDYSGDKVFSLLSRDCKIDSNRSKLFAEYYDKHKLALTYKLGNVGTHLPHIVDVNWEIDYLIKSSSLDTNQNPRFKVTLVTEISSASQDKFENIVFWCTSQEMQDLVYKLEDAVRHCQKIASGH